VVLLEPLSHAEKNESKPCVLKTDDTEFLADPEMVMDVSVTQV